MKEVENQLYSGGLPDDAQVSACANLLVSGSCVQSFGCDCNTLPGEINDEGQPGCQRVPTCANPESSPALVFIDYGLTYVEVNTGTEDDPVMEWVWKPANWEHGCQIAYQCAGEEILYRHQLTANHQYLIAVKPTLMDKTLFREHWWGRHMILIHGLMPVPMTARTIMPFLFLVG